MKVALIGAPSCFGFGQPSPSLALAVLSSSLKSHNVECDCIDCNFLPSFDGNILMREDRILEKQVLNECMELLVQCSPDVVAISSWGVAIPFAIVLSQTVRECYPDIPIIVGGIRSEFLATMLLEHGEQIDATAVGDGESVVLAIVDRIAANSDFHGIRGVAYRDHGNIRFELPGDPLPVSQWCKPDYTSFVLPVGKTYMIEGSRGCIHRCVFCSLNGDQLRRKEAQTLAHEMVELAEERSPDIISLTDNFIPLKGHWTGELCDALLQMETKVDWTCCARADHISLSVIGKMARAGCQRLFLGVESVSFDTLMYISKAPSVANYLSSLMSNIYAILDNGIKLRVSTIVGFPHEGMGDIQRTIEFVLRLQEMGIDAYTGPVVVYPGSRLWDMYMNKQIGLRRILNPEIYRNCAGLFAWRFEDIPYFVPNHFLPEHKFLDQEELESVIADGLRLTKKRFAQQARRIRRSPYGTGQFV